jgi:hypothetical protein
LEYYLLRGKRLLSRKKAKEKSPNVYNTGFLGVPRSFSGDFIIVCRIFQPPS